MFTVGHCIAKWELDIYVPFCNKCKVWGHNVGGCTNAARCVHNCPTLCEGGCKGSGGCLNCGGRHKPWSFGCPKRLEIVKSHALAVDSAVQQLKSTASA